MEKILFNDWQSIINILIITIAAYLSLVFILRISGKRTLSQMNAFDLIITMAIGSTLATVILDINVSLSEGVVALGLLVLLQVILSYISVRNKKISFLIKSSPTLIAYKGKLLKKNMITERIDEDEVWAALRDNGLSSLEEVDAVVLESNGNLTIIEKITNTNAHPVKSLLEEEN